MINIYITILRNDSLQHPSFTNLLLFLQLRREQQIAFYQPLISSSQPYSFSLFLPLFPTRTSREDFVVSRTASWFLFKIFCQCRGLVPVQVSSRRIIARNSGGKKIGGEKIAKGIRDSCFCRTRFCCCSISRLSSDRDAFSVEIHHVLSSSSIP